ncbi:MAG: hypothetical protein AB7G28_14905 [Pirellulales bacterium]
MNTFRTSTEITLDDRIVVALPPEMPLGTAEVIVTVAVQNGEPPHRGNLRSLFGSVHGGDEHAANNGRIDADLNRDPSRGREH